VRALRFWSHLAAGFRVPAMLLAVAVFGGSLGYWAIEGWGFLDALYMTVTTLTTVGFREVHPLGTGGRAFTIVLMASGVLIVFVTIAIIAQLIMSGDLGEPLRRRRMQRRIDALSDHYVLCAFGRVGRATATEFAQQGFSYVVIERQEALERLLVENGAPYIIGDPTEEAVLEQAGVRRAKGLVCAVDSDASNVYITLTARSLNPDLSIVARASAPQSVDQLSRAGADRVVSPYVLSGTRMASLASRPSVVEFVDMVTVAPDMRLEEIVVGPGTRLDGQTVGDARSSNADVRILAVKKEGQELVPTPDRGLVIGAGDIVIALGPTKMLGTLAEGASL
jgi:voltage-gated potassium channel